MTDKKMESFKIGDSHRPTVSSPTSPKAEEETQESFSLGYEKIEKILEQEDPQEMLDGINSSLEKLKELETEATTPKEKLAAGKAVVAYERVADLLEFLFTTKNQMGQPAAK